MKIEIDSYNNIISEEGITSINPSRMELVKSYTSCNKYFDSRSLTPYRMLNFWVTNNLIARQGNTLVKKIRAEWHLVKNHNPMYRYFDSR